MGFFFLSFFFFIFFFASALDNYKNDIYDKNYKLKNKINGVIEENDKITKQIKELEMSEV